MKLALTMLLAGCLHDRYVCATNGDCNLGAAGRCEMDGRCTQLDANCASDRRYSDHAADAGACYVAGGVILDPFAAGQGPALAEGCIAEVCAALPSCCTSGWTEACVQLAEISCDQPHETRIAVSANRSSQPAQLWDLRWSGTAWSATQRTDLATVIGWIAPTPGSTEPRLYGMQSGAVVIDGATPLPLSSVLDSVTSIDFDLSGHDHVAIASHPSGVSTGGIEMVDLGTGDRAQLATDTAYAHVSWGAIDSDPYPDVVASTGGTYIVLSNVAVDGSPARDLRSIANSAESGADIGTSLRSLAWADLDADQQLDLVAFGGALRLHFDPVTGIADRNLDCDPLDDTTTSAGATACPSTVRGALSYAGAASPGQLAIATTADIGTPEVESAGSFYRVATTRSSFTVSPALRAPTCSGPCYSEIRAMALRDLDGDHVLDIIAIDAQLQVIYTLSTIDPDRLIIAAPIATPPAAQTTVSLSVTGAFNP